MEARTWGVEVRGRLSNVCLVLDATECPIRRPTRNQRIYYSGKKKCHTVKYEGNDISFKLSFY